MKFRQAALAGMLSAALVMPAFSQSPDDSPQGGAGQNITQPDDPGSGNPSAGDQSADAQQAIIDVQGKLQDQGYFNDSVNGNWGPSSIAALQLYQEDHGLQPSGAMDQDTAASLGLSLDEFAAFEAAVSQQPGTQGPEQQGPDSQPPAPDQPDENSDQPEESI